MAGKDKQFTVSITEVTLTSGKTKYVRVKVDGQEIQIPVDETLYTEWRDQFHRPTPTLHQRKRFTILMNLIRAAYEKGLSDGKGA